MNNTTIKQLLFATGFLATHFASFSQSPGVRNGHNMVYYSPTKSIILFGGADEAKVYGDTWSFSDGKWEKITDEGPSPRTFPCMVAADIIFCFSEETAFCLETTKLRSTI